MQQEVTGAMEKRPFSCQSPVQFRNNGISGDKKSDFAHHKNSRSRKHGPRGAEATRPSPNSKWNKSYSDKRPRQRSGYGDRQREEVAEPGEPYDVVLSTSSRKGNDGSHLLRFSFAPRESEVVGRWGRGRGGGGDRHRGTYKKLPCYNKEQFLQANCQFVVREGGDYMEQAVNPDGLVSWDMIELIKSFSTEPVTCPICLQVPFAGKITKCGHIYCWACILHYLKLGDDNYRKCPICYDAVRVEDLKSIQCITVPDFSVGDEIEMKLMKKSNGSILVMPKAEWEDREGLPMNMNGGSNTKYMKLLVASLQQIQREVIEAERLALAVHLADAEESEAVFIKMAQGLLDKREACLKKVFKRKVRRKQAPLIPGLVLTPSPSESSSEEEDETESKEPAVAREEMTIATPAMVNSTPSKVYVDAFEDEVQSEANGIPTLPDSPRIEESSGENVSSRSEEKSASLFAIGEDSSAASGDVGEDLPPLDGSPPTPFPKALSLDETVETLGLPQISTPKYVKQGSNQEKAKDAYYFYQVSTGQHMYLHSLNARCLKREYGSLEEAPETVKATIVNIERCFMTEDVRKRMRCLSHVPLTCEFYIMELNFAPPLVSKETMKYFHAEFEKNRKARQRKVRDEKMRAKKYEVDYKKSFGIHPEVKIPLSNLNHFPSPLTASASSPELSSVTDSPGHQADGLEGVSITLFQSGTEASSQECRDVHNASMASSPGTDSSMSETKSFAQMLKAGKSPPQSNAWGRPEVRTRTVSGGSSTGSKEVGDGSDDEDLPAPNYNTSMSDAIAQAFQSMEMRCKSTGNEASSGPAISGGKKKKRKEKQLLFSTAMARKQ